MRAAIHELSLPGGAAPIARWFVVAPLAVPLLPQTRWG